MSDPSAKAFWNPQTGIFDPAQLRQAIVMRGWTVVEFGRVAQVSRGSLYSALLGCGVTDRTAVRIFQALSQRQPFDLAL
jgi:predicted transcriptional regulator